MKRFIITLAVTLISTIAMAQSLEECRRLAREHYPEIKRIEPTIEDMFIKLMKR